MGSLMCIDYRGTIDIEQIPFVHMCSKYLEANLVQIPSVTEYKTAYISYNHSSMVKHVSWIG
jgi:hypothetical protein